MMIPRTCGECQKWERGSCSHFKERMASDEPACIIFVLRAGPERFFEVDEKGRARFVPELLGEEILRTFRLITIRTTGGGEIYIYRDGVYRPLGESYVEEECARLLEKEFMSYRLREVVKYVKAKTYRDWQEAPPNLINLENGILDIDALELLPQDPDMVFFSKVPVKYDPEARCPGIEKFMGEVVSGQEDVRQLEEVAGYCLYRSYIHQKALMLVGEGANGKSTYLSMVKALLGIDNVAAKSLFELEADRFAKADLAGKLANIYPDLPAQFLKRTDTFKMLTGGDMLTAQKKYQGSFNFVNYAKLLFSANSVPPPPEGEADAFFRRWIIITFPNKFEGDDADPTILEKLTTPEELSGFLNLALQGLKRLLTSGRFTVSMTTEEIRMDYQRKASPVYAFVQDCTETDSARILEKAEVYAAYTGYCRDHKLPAQSKEGFWKELPRYAGIRTGSMHKGGKYVYTVEGLGLKDQKAGSMEKIQTLLKLVRDLSSGSLGYALIDSLEERALEAGIMKDVFGPLVARALKEGLLIATEDEGGVRASDRTLSEAEFSVIPNIFLNTMPPRKCCFCTLWRRKGCLMARPKHVSPAARMAEICPAYLQRVDWEKVAERYGDLE